MFPLTIVWSPCYDEGEQYGGQCLCRLAFLFTFVLASFFIALSQLNNSGIGHACAMALTCSSRVFVGVTFCFPFKCVFVDGSVIESTGADSCAESGTRFFSVVPLLVGSTASLRERFLCGCLTIIGESIELQIAKFHACAVCPSSHTKSCRNRKTRDEPTAAFLRPPCTRLAPYSCEAAASRPTIAFGTDCSRSGRSRSFSDFEAQLAFRRSPAKFIASQLTQYMATHVKCRSLALANRILRGWTNAGRE